MQSAQYVPAEQESESVSTNQLIIGNCSKLFNEPVCFFIFVSSTSIRANMSLKEHYKGISSHSMSDE